MVDKIIKLIQRGLESFNLYYSSYLGVVVGHLKSNPSMLIIQVQEVTGDYINYRVPAYPKNVGGGNNWGGQILPQVGDTIWVEYLQGRVDHPVWSLSYRTASQKIKEFKNSRTYGFKSPHGTYVSINDDEDLFTLQHRWLNTDEGKVIDGAKLTIDKDVVKLTHLEHNIELTLDSLKITTTKPLEVNSDANININSAENIIFNNGEKGNMVDINKLVEQVNADRDKFNSHMHQVTLINNVTSTPIGGPVIVLPGPPQTSTGTPLTPGPPASTTDFDNDKIQQ